MILPVIAGIISSLLALSPISSKVGIAVWCTVNNNDQTVQCNYKTKQECEDYRQEDETCVKNPVKDK